MKETIRFVLNGQTKEITVDPERTLLWVLRNDLELTGTKYGCGMGYCGACSILIDDKAVRSCMITADFVNGKNVVTIEGLGTEEKLHPVQEAFLKHDALQCGYCTPGMIIRATALLKDNPMPSRDEIILALDDNFCRCGAHTRIIDAVQTAGKELKGGK